MVDGGGGPRRIGKLSEGVVIAVDVAVNTPAAAAAAAAGSGSNGSTREEVAVEPVEEYQLSAYFVDW
jgi:hypothetical protein